MTRVVARAESRAAGLRRIATVRPGRLRDYLNL
jgi:hypothetical protein